jgi:hypothetical protein
LVRGPELNTDPLIPVRGTSFPGFVWDHGGYSRLRLSWQGGMRPEQTVYENIDPNGHYTIRVNGRGEMLLWVNKKQIEPASDSGRDSGEPTAAAAPGSRARVTPEFTSFPIPQELLKDRRIVVDWNNPNQPHTGGLRLGAYVAEVWLLKQQ